MICRRALTALLLVTASAAASLAQAPLGAAFAYQGRLVQSGAPVTGSVDMIFTLWNDPVLAVPANQVGGAIAFDGVGANPPRVSVTSGLFTVLLNQSGQFGSTAFDGNARWLQIQVRFPAGVGGYTTLSPRQQLTGAPYALYSTAPWAPVTNGVAFGQAEFATAAIGGMHLNVGSTVSLYARNIAGHPSGDGGALVVRDELGNPIADIEAGYDCGGRLIVSDCAGGSMSYSGADFDGGSGKLVLKNATTESVTLDPYAAGGAQVRVTDAAGATMVALSGANGGQVGIGTASPQTSLHVVGSPTLASVRIAPNEVINGDDSELQLSEDVANNFGMSLYYDGGLNQLRVFGKANATVSGPHLAIARDSGNVGIGTTSPAGKFHVSAAAGDTSVIVPNDSLSSLEMLDEPGVANFLDNNWAVVLGTSITTLTSRTITVPAAGYVLAIGTTEVRVTHVNNTTTATDATLGVSATPSAFILGADTNLQYWQSMPTGDNFVPVTVHALIPVAAGANTIYFIGRRNSTSVCSGPVCSGFLAQDIELTLVYLATAYGTTQRPSAAASPEQEDPSTAPRAGLTPQEIDAEQAAAREADAARMARELREAQRQIEELRARLEEVQRAIDAVTPAAPPTSALRQDGSAADE
ncbi:MAG: hypothetical protein U1D55_13570 [Phycisphaerae bacterium]